MDPELVALLSPLQALHARARALLPRGGSVALALVPLLGTLDQLEATLRRIDYLQRARWREAAFGAREELRQLGANAEFHALDAGLSLTPEEREALAALTRAEAA